MSTRPRALAAVPLRSATPPPGAPDPDLDRLAGQLGDLAAEITRTLAGAVRAMVRDEVRRAVAELAHPPAPPAPSDYLSTADAAKVAGVAEKTVRAWARSGQLASHRAGRLLRIRRADLEALLRQQPGGDTPVDTDELADRLLRRIGR